MNRGNNKLTTAFEKHIAEAARALDGFPWESQDAYALWLSQTYYLVRHTTRFLALAAARAPIGERELHYGFVHHLKEESHHDLPLIKDLKALGSSPEQFPVLPETRMIIHNQYYWLEHGSVHSLSGYALLLEGLSVRCIPEMLKRLSAAGLGKATTFLKLHMEVDQEHFKEGTSALEHVPQAFYDEVLMNLEESALQYIRLYERVVGLTATQKSTRIPTRKAG